MKVAIYLLMTRPIGRFILAGSCLVYYRIRESWKKRRSRPSRQWIQRDRGLCWTTPRCLLLATQKQRCFMVASHWITATIPSKWLSATVSPGKPVPKTDSFTATRGEVEDTKMPPLAGEPVPVKAQDENTRGPFTTESAATFCLARPLFWTLAKFQSNMVLGRGFAKTLRTLDITALQSMYTAKII